jgi:hypothetical protein
MPAKKKRDEYSGPPVRHFSLAPHQTLLRTDYGHLIQPSGNGGLTLHTSPDGLPVIRQHADLRPGEINFVLR